MADYAISPEFLKSYRDWQNQRQATTGIAPRPEDFQALAEANLNVQASSKYRDRALQQEQQRIDMQKEEADKQQRAATVSGVSGVVNSAVTTWGVGKSLGWWGTSGSATSAGGTAVGGTAVGGTAAGGSSAGGSSAAGTAGTVAGYAVLGYYANRLMQGTTQKWSSHYLGPNWGVHGFTNQAAAIVGDIIGGKTGRTVANVLDPAGNVIEQSTNNIHKVTGTVICTELHRQGIISDRMKRYGAMFGRQVGHEVYCGYLVAAEPVVERMKRSKLYAWYVAFFAIPAIKEMAHRVQPREKSNLFGSFVLKMGIQYCLKVYDEIPEEELNAPVR